MDSRYAHEWLEQQVTTGILSVEGLDGDPDERLYDIPAGAAEVLTDHDSLAYLAPLVRLLVAGSLQLPSLIDAYRSGGGVPWAQFGTDMRTGQADMNRPWFLQEHSAGWLPAVPDLHAALEQGARVADVGCGEGWSAIGLALAYPASEVDGYDIDVPSIEAARQHAAAYGVSDRVSFHAVDASGVEAAAGYDVVTAFECIHDLSDPVGVLSAMRRLARPGGQVMIMDEAVGGSFGDRADDVERLMYGFSLFVCLPDGMAHQPSAQTGTLMRKPTLDRYAGEAGFAGVEVLPIENDLWRFYRLLLPVDS